MFSCQFRFQDELSLNVRIFEFNLTLRRAFGTSYSSTSSRQNGLLELSFAGCQGYSEVGLPPKKPFCYEADLEDIMTYVKSYVATLKKVFDSDTGSALKVIDFQSSIDLSHIQIGKSETFQSDPFAQSANYFFSALKQNAPSKLSLNLDCESKYENENANASG